MNRISLSVDFTPPDFFLGGYLKSKVYASKPTTIAELKENIRAEMEAIPPEMLEKSWRMRKKSTISNQK